MSLVKKIIIGACLVLAAGWALGRADGSVREPGSAAVAGEFRPARADLAEAVLTMILDRAEEAGMERPVTLCEACAAANLGLPRETVRGRCAKACGLR